MQKNYTQLLLGLLIGLLAGLLLGKFVFNPKATNTQSVITFPAKNNNGIKNNNAPSVNDNSSNFNNTNHKNDGNGNATLVDQNIPQKVYEVLKIVKETGKAPNGYVGGRTFENRERQLPMNDDNGNKILYQEWDVNPKVNGQNRGAERMVTGSDNRNWFTSNHYRSFTLIK